MIEAEDLRRMQRASFKQQLLCFSEFKKKLGVVGGGGVLLRKTGKIALLVTQTCGG